jgi:DNA-binding HxlR family transcriptional regulator
MTQLKKKIYNYPFGCSVEATLSVIGGRWKPLIMSHLKENDCLRFGELKRQIDGITERMLTNQLRELEADNVVSRTVYAEVPPRVEYALTDYGHSLDPILLSMRDWGSKHMEVSAGRQFECAVDATLSVIGGRWKPVIIFHLINEEFMRFGALKRSIAGITERMLTKQLRELEHDKIVSRKVYAEVPPRVEYSLCDYGFTLESIMLSMRDWGADHVQFQV